MKYDKEAFSLLIKETKESYKPFKLEQVDLEIILNVDQFNSKLLKHLIKKAKEENVILATYDFEYIFICDYYPCQYERVYRENFNEYEIYDTEEILRPESELMVAKEKVELLENKIELLKEKVLKLSNSNTKIKCVLAVTRSAILATRSRKFWNSRSLVF